MMMMAMTRLRWTIFAGLTRPRCGEGIGGVVLRFCGRDGAGVGFLERACGWRSGGGEGGAEVVGGGGGEGWLVDGTRKWVEVGLVVGARVGWSSAEWWWR